MLLCLTIRRMDVVSIIFILLTVLLSCDGQMKTSEENLDTRVVENIKFGDAFMPGNRLFGEWTVHLSCDGSIMCNVCPRISFKSDGFGTTIDAMGGIQNLKWKMNADNIEISNFETNNIVDNGKYVMTYWTEKDIIELTLINAANSHCYKFSREIRKSDWR